MSKPINYALASGVALALLGGCSLAPTYERPSAPTAATWPGATQGAPATKAAADIAWQEYFVDARLKRLIELALANNRDLRVAALNVPVPRAEVLEDIAIPNTARIVAACRKVVS